MAAVTSCTNALYNDIFVLTFIAGNFAYGAVPVASSIAVIPKLQISALLLYAVT
jgi:hypothetical protein